MKKTVYFLPFFFLFLLIAACQSKTVKVQFAGESDHWLAEVILLQAKDEERKSVKLSYTGEDMKSLTEVEYEIESPTWSIYQKGNLAEGTFESPGETITSGNTNQNAELKMTIVWNNQTEEIVLKNK